MTAGMNLPYVEAIPTRGGVSVAIRPETTESRIDSLDGGSKKRRLTSRVVIILAALWFLALNVFGLLEPFFMWLPAETVAEMFGEETSFIALHRTHAMAIGIVAWAIVLSMLVQLRKPERRLAPMLLLVGAAAAGTVLFGLSGTLAEWLMEEIAFVLVPIGLVVLVHPGRDSLLTKPAFDRRMGGLAVAAAIPWLFYILNNAWLQLVNTDGDPHAAMEHWGIAGLMGVSIALSAILGASSKPGWALTAWLAVGGSVVFGVHSLVFPGLASALPAFWAVAAILWGVGYGSMTVRRSRSDAINVA